ncbi:MAG: hypothetical protein RLZZ606_1028 [Actinomycetota bacterium]
MLTDKAVSLVLREMRPHRLLRKFGAGVDLGIYSSFLNVRYM